MKLTTHLRIVPRLRIIETMSSAPFVCLHGVDKENFTFYCLKIFAFFLICPVHVFYFSKLPAFFEM